MDKILPSSYSSTNDLRAEKRFQFLTPLLVIVFISAHFVLGFTSLIQKAPTADEYTYISTAYLYLQTGDYRLDQTHPPLIRFLIGIPLQFLTIELPPLQKELWDTNASYTLGYQIGWEMLLSGMNHWPTVVIWSRLPILLLSCLLAWLVFSWSTKIYGTGGGLTALFFYALSPNILAHARLATLDLGISFFFVATLICLHMLNEKQNRWWLVAAGVSLGLAFASKVTAILLLPALLVYGVFAQKKVLSRQLGLQIGGMILLALLVLLLVYQWPFKPFYYGNTLSNVFVKSLQLQDRQEVIPGMPHQQHAFYLFGEYSTEGWPYYFFAAFLVKTPIVGFLAVLVGLIFCEKRWYGYLDTLILSTIAVLFLASAFNKVNIGVRHILPVYPLLHIYLGRVWQIKAVPYGKWILFFLAVIYINGTLMAYPNFIPYFNEFAGGAEQGHLYLDDSNLDWGQDLNRLQAVQAQFPDVPFYVATNWMFHDQAFGLDAELLSKEQIANPPKGIIAVGKHWAIRNQISKRSPYYFDWLEKNPPIMTVGDSIWVFDWR